MERRIVLASDNQGKINEFKHLFSQLPIEFVPQSIFNISSAAETGMTFVENALLKARHASMCSQLPALADDSGLVVSALHGAPGIYSARYAGEKAGSNDNIKKLLQELTQVSQEKRQAYFYCVLVYLEYPDDPAPIICEGRWQGHILFAPQGKEGFGYDPVFYVPGHACSAAELALSIKNTISHRAQAVQTLLKKLSC